MESYQFSFEKLIAWQKARELVKEIYKITGQYPEREKFVLINQIRRSAISIASNLAEGNSKESKKEKLRYFSIAYSSLLELYNQLIISTDLDYLSINNFNELKSKVIELSKILNGLRKSFK